MIERSRVRLPAGALSGNNFGQVANTHVPLSPSSTIFGTGQRAVMLCGREGNRIGLASHWPIHTSQDFSGLSRPPRGRWAPHLRSNLGGWYTLPFNLVGDSHRILLAKFWYVVISLFFVYFFLFFLFLLPFTVNKDVYIKFTCPGMWILMSRKNGTVIVCEPFVLHSWLI